MNQLTSVDSVKSKDIAILYPELDKKKLKAVRLLSSGLGISTVASSVGVLESVVADWMGEDDFVGAMSFASAKNDLLPALQRDANILSWMLIVDTLAKDFDSVPASAKVEMLRIARAIVLSSKEISNTGNTNVGTVQMYVSGGSVDAIARRVTELQSDKDKDNSQEIEKDYDIIDVDAQFSVHPDTDIGTINYDEETDTSQCHVCGKWMRDLGMHAVNIHGLSAERYRDLYGIAKW